MLLSAGADAKARCVPVEGKGFPPCSQPAERRGFQRGGVSLPSASLSFSYEGHRKANPPQCESSRASLGTALTALHRSESPSLQHLPVLFLRENTSPSPSTAPEHTVGTGPAPDTQLGHAETPTVSQASF